jgi:lytic murein transglycosylase
MTKQTFRIAARALKAASAALALASPSLAQDQSSAVGDFKTFAAQLGRQAFTAGVSPRTIDAVFPTLYANQTVISLDRAQPGNYPNDPNAPIPKFAPYAARHVDSVRIARGRAKYQALRGLLGRVERETGVPEAIMIAIWGNETNYGAFTGNFDLANSLATLAWEGRRRALFTEEFIATLKLMDRGFARERLKGSWAGATGLPQFLPSQYLRLARDGDGDGRADIWTSEADAMASIANYFHQAGWRAGEPWGGHATVSSGFDRTTLATRTASPRCARVHGRLSRWLTVAEWRALGVVQTGGRQMADSTMASLIEPDGPGTPAYLLSGNYRVILDYNCSNFYGLSVGLLADAVEK